MPLCFKPEIIYSVFNKKVSLANISLKLTVKGPLIGFFHRGELNITGKTFLIYEGSGLQNLLWK